MLYHYVDVHKYSPPDEFIKAVFDSDMPLGQDYLDRLGKLDAGWRKTSEYDAQIHRWHDA